MDAEGRAFPITATGVVDAGRGVLLSFSVTAAAAAALLVLTDTATGAELGRVAAVATTTGQRLFAHGVPYAGLTATLTGAGALGDAEVA